MVTETALTRKITAFVKFHHHLEMSCSQTLISDTNLPNSIKFSWSPDNEYSCMLSLPELCCSSFHHQVKISTFTQELLKSGTFSRRSLGTFLLPLRLNPFNYGYIMSLTMTTVVTFKNILSSYDQMGKLS